MTTHSLYFSHAFTGRLAPLPEKGPRSSASSVSSDLSVSPVSSVAPVSLGVGKECAQLLAQRLYDEVQSGALPFLDLGFLEHLEKVLPQTLAALPPAKHLILLGVGGSSLGAKALQKAFAPGQDRPGHQGPWLWIADNIDSLTMESWLATLDPNEVVVAVISKSGSTIETMAQYFLLKAWLQGHLNNDWSKRVVAITDEGKGALRQEADACGLISLPVPASLGGRYSIMSAVGMFPSAFLGMDWRGFLRGLKSVTQQLTSPGESGPTQAVLGQTQDVSEYTQGAFAHYASGHASSGQPSLAGHLSGHPAFRLASWAHALMAHGYDELIFFNYIPLWSEVGQWFAQLWAESLGKGGKGSMPIPAVGVSDQHSLQQMFLDGKANKGCLFIHSPHLPAGPMFGETVLPGWEYLKGQHFGDVLQAEAMGTRLAFIHKEIPLVECALTSTDEEACGHLMGLLMATTLLTGWMLEINPLDQPAVEFGKRLANAKLGAPGYEDEKKMLEKNLKKPAEGDACIF